LMLPKRARPAPALRVDRGTVGGRLDISISPLKLQLNPASCTMTGAASFLTLTSSLNQRTRYCS
jgi:hypothetical protein